MQDELGQNTITMITVLRHMENEIIRHPAVLEATGLSTDRLILYLTHTHAAAGISLSMVDYPGGHLIPATKRLSAPSSLGSAAASNCIRCPSRMSS